MARMMVVAMLVLGLAVPAAAQFPERSVSIVVPYPAGGLTDLVARALAEGMRARLPRGVAVVNRPGAGGSIGITELVQAPATGYTIALTPIAALVVQPQLNALPYKTPDDYDLILNTVSAHQLLAVRGDAPWKTGKDLVEAARQEPGKLRVGSSGVGTSAHLNLEELIAAARITVTHVPFSGWAEGSVALLGGHIDALVVNPGEVRPQVDARRMRIIGAFQPTRSPFYADVPTFKELGWEAGVGLWWIALAPRGTPPAALRHLHEAAKAAIESEAFVKFARAREIEIDYRPGDRLKADLWHEYRRHTEILTRLGMLKK